MAARIASTTCVSTRTRGLALGGRCIMYRRYSMDVLPWCSCRSHRSTACLGVRDVSMRVSRFCLIIGANLDLLDSAAQSQSSRARQSCCLNGLRLQGPLREWPNAPPVNPFLSRSAECLKDIQWRWTPADQAHPVVLDLSFPLEVLQCQTQCEVT